MRTIFYGIESGSQKMLDVMRKGESVEQSRAAIRLTKRIGVNMHTPLMIGFPGETKETIEESVNFFIQENIAGIAGTIYFPTPHPGSALWEYALKNKLIKDEEYYIENLGDFTSLHLNLTDMPDEKLIQLKKYAAKRIFWLYFFKYLYNLPFIIIEQIKTIGYNKTLINLSRIMSTFKQFIS